MSIDSVLEDGTVSFLSGCLGQFFPYWGQIIIILASTELVQLIDADLPPSGRFFLCLSVFFVFFGSPL